MVSVGLDCSAQTFNKQAYGVSRDTAVYPFFINEAAYYEKGIAMMLGTRQEKTFAVIDL